jgi:hypothetical protein
LNGTPLKSAYEDRALAYIDILGFSALIQENEVHKIRSALQLIQSHAARLEALPKAPITTSAFSDTIVLSSRNDENGLPYLVHAAAALAAELLMRGILCRGAITNGKLFHRRDTIYGPALIDAYQMEQQLAIYPRVIINFSVLEKFVEFRNQQLGQSRQRSFSHYFRNDFDNQYHLDLFSPFLFVPRVSGTIRQTVVKRVNKHILAMIDADDKIETQRKMAKVFWLGRYMDYVREVHGAWQIGNRRSRRGPRNASDN